MDNHKSEVWHMTPEQITLDPSTPNGMVEFDSQLLTAWDAKMQQGLFKYDLEHVRYRKLANDAYDVDAVANSKRCTLKRQPVKIHRLDAPYESDQFNFTKVNDREVIFEVQFPVVDECTTMKFSEGNVENSNLCSEGKPSGEIIKSLMPSESFNEQSGQPPDKHLVLINISPIERGHSLIVPYVNHEHNQVLRADSIEIALRVFLQSGSRRFLLLYNSLLAYASVNHLHFHVYYLPTDKISLMSQSVVRLRSTGIHLFALHDWLTPGWALQLTSTATIPEYARLIYAASGVCIRNGYALNLAVLRRRPFTDTVGAEKRVLSEEIHDPNDGDHLLVTSYIFPKRPVYDNVYEGLRMVPAVCETAGQVVVYDEAYFDVVTGPDVYNMFEPVRPTEKEFERLTNELMEMIN